MDMTITVVTEKQQLALQSLTNARARLEQAKADAEAANQSMFEALVLNDTEAENLDERIAAEEKNIQCEEEAERAWVRYGKSLIRYRWELTEAQRQGIIE
jgi:hypothetical protein